MKAKQIIAPLLAFIIVIACLFGINSFTAPIIAENEFSSLLGPLAEVLPEASQLNEITLEGLPETVTSVYEDVDGVGYAVKLSTTQGYTGSPIELALGISSDGKVTGLQITEYADTKDVTDDFIYSFVEKDSALSGVDLVSGATYSSSAIKNAVGDALNYMADNGMITAGIKSDSQIFAEMLPALAPDMANASGILQLSEDSSDNLMISLNEFCAAFVISNGDSSLVQIINADGFFVTYDAEGNIVNEALCSELESVSLSNTVDRDLNKLTNLAGDNAELEAIPLDGIYNCVTSAFKVTTPDGTYYAFGTSPYAYSNEIMPVYFILDENGAISKMTAPDFILFGEYFTSYDLDKDSYKEGFNGLSADTFTDDVALISGATMSSDAVSMATKAVFDAFAILGCAN